MKNIFDPCNEDEFHEAVARVEKLLQGWTFAPYTNEEIAAMRAKPGKLSAPETGEPESDRGCPA